MTLFKQLFWGASIAFLLVLGATEGVYIRNARKYMQENLASHSQEIATSLGMTLPASMADGDLIRMEAAVNAVFDRGFYQSIRVVDTKGVTMLLKTLPLAPADVPEWVVKVLPLQSPVAESLVSKGWRQMGRVVVISHPNFAYKQLWRTLLEAVLGLSVLYLLVLLALHRFLSRILSPLTDIENVANGIGKLDFQQVKSQPRARELRSIVNAINSMSIKLRAIIDHEVQQAIRFRQEAHKDAISNLDNRRSFEQYMQILSHDDSPGSGVMYMLQIANFKQFVASNGFREGDALLVAVGDALISTQSEKDWLRARINEATFAVVAFNISREEAVRLGDELCAALAAVIDTRFGQARLLFGCGGAYFSGKKVTVSALLAQSDLAMLQSQANGQPLNVLQDLDDGGDASKGSQYWKQLIFDAAQTEIILDALQSESLALLPQPVIGLEDFQLIQVEVLGRIRNRRGEIVPAGQFISMANRHDLTPAFDLAVLRKLIDVMKSSLLASEKVAVNLSIHSIQDKHLLDWLMPVLRANPAVSERLIFEFAEFGVAQHIEAMEKFIAEIRALGAEFAVDNFGLHHSAFEYLQKLKPAYIKLGLGYIRELLDSRENQFFISSVVNIAQSLEIKVIALGVEDPEILSLLQQLGVDGYQGYVGGDLQELVTSTVGPKQSPAAQTAFEAGLEWMDVCLAKQVRTYGRVIIARKFLSKKFCASSKIKMCKGCEHSS